MSIENQITTTDVVDENPAPSSLHVWTGDAWVLPAEHELSMLAELEADADERAATEEAINDRLEVQNDQLNAEEEMI